MVQSMSKRGRTVFVGMAVIAAAVLAASCDSGGEMVILDINPKVGHTQGEQSVRILGKNFRQDIGYTIYFGTKKTSSVTIRDPETMEVVTPAGMDKGKVDIMIRADDGNAFRIVQAFTFEDMGGNVVQGIGGPGAPKQDKGNLAY
jgi:hypothetical protein